MNRFQKAAQKIGNESDRIDLYIGCQLQKVKFADVNGKLRVKSNPEDICYLRTNTLDAYINGEIQVINFISGCGPTKKYDIKNLLSQVMRYINSLK